MMTATTEKAATIPRTQSQISTTTPSVNHTHRRHSVQCPPMVGPGPDPPSVLSSDPAQGPVGGCGAAPTAGSTDTSHAATGLGALAQLPIGEWLGTPPARIGD